jgi:hypothetical protein
MAGEGAKIEGRVMVAGVSLQSNKAKSLQACGYPTAKI